MAVLILHDSNIRALKSILMTDFGMKSSHASEAISALVGFKSYAALQASRALERQSFVADIDFGAFEDRATKLGYLRDSSEYLSLTFRHLKMPVQPWKQIQKRNDHLREVWYRECEQEGRPFIVIEKARRYCALSWDCAHIGSEKFHLFRDCAGEDRMRVMRRFFWLVKGEDSPKSDFNGSWHVGDIVKLEEASARQIADGFAKLLSLANVENEHRVVT